MHPGSTGNGRSQWPIYVPAILKVLKPAKLFDVLPWAYEFVCPQQWVKFVA
ncbi:hypothetical protein HMPREF0299_6296 [Corynebacterium matruchotii ATCC 14266]|uniref:Uncharacterized protein n=1 Tax=Corynebacterium matruchotii ATCC 14266 TaxID=553207 RepID=E0DD95_9CORY|nr:hypothetical protein HMPREF0299_6296 [Corynebacterium matruchotii ATCC 14266]